MTTYAGTCYELASIAGQVAYGAFMTSYGAFRWKLHEFGPGGGMGAPGIKPAKIKSVPMLTLGGTLCVAVAGVLGSTCAISGATFDDNSRGPGVTGVDCVYGDATGDGFATTGCVGTQLTISGSTNELVTFSLAMFGKTTTKGSGPGGGGGDTAEFFPFELGSNTHGDALLGFTLTVNTGLIPAFGMDSQGPDGWVNCADVGATCTLQLVMATTDLWDTANGITPGATTITLASPGGGSLGITVNGYYTKWDRSPVAGLIGHGVTLTGHGASMVDVT
jgi:hypothetical protein